MMSLTLAPGISFVEHAGERIFLDLYRDCYFALGPLADHAFTALTRGKPDEHQKAHLLGLVDRKILVDLPFGDNPRPCRQPNLIGSALDGVDMTPPSRWRILVASVSIMRAKRRLRARTLASNVERLRALKSASAADRRPPRAGECERIAAAFAAAGRWIATLDQCLALSFAMARTCLASGCDAQLTIGIKLRPFEAHAWVSIDGIVISDRLDNVRPFAAVLVI